MWIGKYFYDEQTKAAKNNYLNLRWKTKEQRIIRIKDMPRSHIQNTLNWCIRKNKDATDEKDGITYQMWIVYFTARLLDPNLK